MITRVRNVEHHPLQFIKPIDKSSPLLSMAISSNELLNAVFFFYRINPAGQLELFHEVKLTETSIVDVSCTYPHSINDAV